MQLNAKELAIINIAVNNAPYPTKADRQIGKDVQGVIMKFTEGEGDAKKFVDADVELSTVQKACILKLLPLVQWNLAQGDLSDALEAKLS